MTVNFTKAKLDAVLGGIIRNKGVPDPCLRCHGDCRAYLEELRRHLSEEEVFCFFYAAQFVKSDEDTRNSLTYVWPELLMHTLEGCGRALDEKIFAKQHLASDCGNVKRETEEVLKVMEGLKPKSIFYVDSLSVRKNEAQWAIPSALYRLACKLNAEQHSKQS